MVPVIITDPGIIPGVTVRPAVDRRPIGGREKEAKVRVAGLALGEALLGFVTESMDFLGALYKALPWCVRPPGYVSPAKMAETLYKNWEYLDLREAMANLVKNQVGDAVIGKLQGVLGKQSGKMGLQYSIGGRMLGLGSEEPDPLTGIPGEAAANAVRLVMSDYVPPKVPKAVCDAKRKEVKRLGKEKQKGWSTLHKALNHAENIQDYYGDRILDLTDVNAQGAAQVLADYEERFGATIWRASIRNGYYPSTEVDTRPPKFTNVLGNYPGT